MSDGLVAIDHPAEHVARITLNRPDRLNAMSIDLVIELWDALEAVAAENDSWVVVLTGAGRAFCSGLDLKDYGIIPNIDGLQVGRIAQRSMRYYSRLIPKMREIPQPIVAAIMLWPGTAWSLPSVYLPIRGPRNSTPIRAAQPPTECTCVDPAKSAKPRSWSQPPPHIQ